MNREETIDYINKTYWGGLGYCDGRKTATDKYSSVSGLKQQNSNTLFFFVKKETGLEIVKHGME